MDKIKRYAILAIAIMLVSLNYAPELFGETSKEVVTTDNSSNNGNLVLSADGAVTIDENQSVDLISALNVQASFNGTYDQALLDKVMVDTNLNVAVPGTYSVTFLLNNEMLGISDSVTSTVYVENVKPVLTTSKSSISVKVGASVDLIDAFGASASEFATGDLNSRIKVTTSADFSKAGSYPVEFSVTDDEGAAAYRKTTLEVSDIPALDIKTSKKQSATVRTASIDVEPKIYAELNKVTMATGSPEPTLAELIAMFGITAKEFVFGDTIITAEYTDAGGIDMDKARSYPIKFTATDQDGQTATTEVTLQLKGNTEEDDLEPVLSVADFYSIMEGTEISDEMLIDGFEASALDEEDGPLDVLVSHGSIDTNVPGEYQIAFVVTDSGGNTVSEFATLIIGDLKPMITFETNPVTMTYGDELPDLMMEFGIVASEITTGDLTSAVMFEQPVITGPGEYMITFEVYDQEMNMDSVTLILKVMPKVNFAPQITGNNYVSIDESNSPLDLIELLSIHATDLEEGILETVVVEQGPVDANTPGIYQVKFSATDSEGSMAYFYGTLQIRDIMPKITTEKSIMVVPMGTTSIDYVTEFGIHATELITDDIISSLVIDDSNVDFTKAGVYKVDLKAYDEEENMATYSIYVVVGNPQPLSIAISSDKYQMVYEETSISFTNLIDLFNMSVTTSELENITESIKIEGGYNTSVPGLYDMVIVVDHMGIHQEFEFQLEVVDMLPFIFTNNSMVTIKDTDKVEDLIAMFDVVAGEIELNDLYEMITVDSSSIMMEDGKYVPGLYPIVFSVVDEEGNMSSATASLEVVATDAPIDEEETPTPEEPEPAAEEDDDYTVAMDGETVVNEDQETEEMAESSMNVLARTGQASIGIVVLLVFIGFTVYALKLSMLMKTK